MKSRGNKRRSGHNLPGCEGCVDIVKEEARFRKVQQKNEDSQTSEGKEFTSSSQISFHLIPVYASGKMTISCTV